MTGTSDDRWVGIDELLTICDEEYASHLGWFVLLGRRVPQVREPELQRALATAAHRHAWHAELWAERRPAIPQDAVHELPPPAVMTVEEDDELLAAYRSHLVGRRARYAQLRKTIDAELDPSTHRVLDLVEADLVQIASRLPA